MWRGIKALWKGIWMDWNKGSGWKRQAARGLVFLAAAGMMAWGVYRGEMTVMLGKAVNVCLECIGLG